MDYYLKIVFLLLAKYFAIIAICVKIHFKIFYFLILVAYSKTLLNI